MRQGNKINLKLIMALLSVSVISLMSCEKFQSQQPLVDPNATWSFKNDIQPIFTGNCISCHGGTRNPDLRDGKSFQSLTNGHYIDLPAESSLLYSTMSSSGHISRSSEEDRLKVLYWITQGAQNN